MSLHAVQDTEPCPRCGAAFNPYHPHLPHCQLSESMGLPWTKPPDELFRSDMLAKAKLLEKYLVINRQNAQFPHQIRAAGISAALAYQLVKYPTPLEGASNEQRTERTEGQCGLEAPSARGPLPEADPNRPADR